MAKVTLTSEELEQAREWIADCPWADLTAQDIKLLTPQEIEHGIRVFFDGEIKEFTICLK